MSDIPHARRILQQLLKDLENFDADIMQTRAAVKSALKHMFKGKSHDQLSEATTTRSEKRKATAQQSNARQDT